MIYNTVPIEGFSVRILQNLLTSLIRLVDAALSLPKGSFETLSSVPFVMFVAQSKHDVPNNMGCVHDQMFLNIV